MEATVEGKVAVGAVMRSKIVRGTTAGAAGGSAPSANSTTIGIPSKVSPINESSSK